MTIYVCTSGRYSEYSIDAVFLTKEKAELYAYTHNGNVEEYDTADDTISASDVYNAYRITYCPKNANPFNIKRWGTVEKDTNADTFRCAFDICYYTFCSKKKYSDDELKKIFFDKLTEEKARWGEIT